MFIFIPVFFVLHQSNNKAAKSDTTGITLYQSNYIYPLCCVCTGLDTSKGRQLSYRLRL